MARFFRQLTCLALLLATVGITSCDRTETGGIYVVTNGIDPFWDLAEAGAMKAGDELGVKVYVLKPPEGTADQNRMVENLMVNQADALAISPIDNKNQIKLIDSAAAKMPVMTFDSDAPDSKRLLFLGVDNFKAGRATGKLVKEAIPDGGEVMIFIGRLEQLNARQRTQGVIDELLDLPEGETAFDDDERNFNAKNIAAGKYTILGVQTDSFNTPAGRAKQQAEDALSANANLKCMVGLFAYNPPAILDAVRDAKKLGLVKIVGFDEQTATLQGIVDGHIHGTVSQQPFNYGYKSVQICKKLIDGDKSAIPENGVVDMPLLVVRKDNVQEFWDKLKADIASVKKSGE